MEGREWKEETQIGLGSIKILGLDFIDEKTKLYLVIESRERRERQKLGFTVVERE